MQGLQDMNKWIRSKKCSTGKCVELFKTNKEIFIRSSENPMDIAVMSHEEWETFKKDIIEGNYEF